MSRSNPLLKRVGAVHAGREPGTIVLEGDRLIDDALRAGHRVEVVLVDEDRAERTAELERARVPVQPVEAGLLQRVSALKTSPGILALCPAPAPVAVDALELSARTLLLVVAGVADPGNLGALARAAEAFGAEALVVARGGASPWNEKALRGSMGSLLRLPVAADLDAETIASSLARRGVRQVAAATRAGADPRRFDWKGPIALWVGAETGALPEVARGFETVTIPTTGDVESLNVTVAAALLLFTSGRADERDGRDARSRGAR